MFAGLLMIGASIEGLVWVAICTGLLLGLLLWIGEGMQHAISWIRRHTPNAHLSLPHVATFLLATSLAGVVLAIPALAAAQGWWGGSPINPGFDRNTVIEVTGTATQVNLAPRRGPSTLQLETAGETYTVMLGPGWYLAELHVDIRNGDSLAVEGSKMMDGWGHLHLAAARIRNLRTGITLELRDEAGRLRWMPGGPPNRIGR